VPPSTTAFGDGTAPFGAGFIQSTLGSPRLIQMALHLTFSSSEHSIQDRFILRGRFCGPVFFCLRQIQRCKQEDIFKEL
jgi:hypothetical protein